MDDGQMRALNAQNVSNVLKYVLSIFNEKDIETLLFFLNFCLTNW